MAFDMPLEWGKIGEFARATGSSNPAYDGPGAVIPPTFLTTARLVWEPEADSPLASLGLDMHRVLHGEEEYVFAGALPAAGQTLTVSSRLVERYEKEGRRGGRMRFARIVSEFRDALGNVVAEQRSTVVETAPAAVEES
jgi:hypothetical protein